LKVAISDYLDLPSVFFGHSLGGLVSHRLLVELVKQGLSPVELFVVSGRPAPSDENLYYDRISHLSDVEFLDKLPEYGGTPEIFLSNSEMMKLYLPILRSDFVLSESEQEDLRPLPCPIAVFSGIDDRMPQEKLKLWERETSNSCEIHMFAGDHFFINQNKKAVLSKLSDVIVQTISLKYLKKQQ